jgi:hypothetical protein
VIEWDATARFETASVAIPPLSIPVPIVVVPSLKVTDPVALDGDTLAVSAIDCPKVDGFVEEVRVVAVGAWLTV